jgi:hypothetical protein
MYCNKQYYNNKDTIIIKLKLNTLSDTKCIINLYNFNNNIIMSKNIDFIYSNENINSKDTYYKYNSTHIGYFNLDGNLKSNVYYLKYESNIFPITIITEEQKDIIVVFPINTIQAYNDIGNKNLYHSYKPEHRSNSHLNRARKVTFNRPINESQIFLFESEFIKWFEHTNYNMKYITDHQLEDISNFDDCKLLIIIGHNEYITRKAVDNMQNFVNAGKNMLVLSGNTFWWQVRYEDNMNTLVCYKNSKEDPITDNKLKTINLPNQMDIYSLIGLDFRLGGYGRNKAKTYKEYCEIKNLSCNGTLLDNKIDYSKIKKTNDNSNIIPGFDGIKILEDHILFKDIVKKNDVLEISSTESDGFKVTSFIDNTLVYDKNEFYRYKVLGYDIMWRAGLTMAGFIACQKTENSGIVINTGTTDWCSDKGMGGKSSDEIKQITKNMINILIQDKSIISNKIFV